MTIKIDPELEALLPPLKQDETDTLEKQLLAEGCRDPLITWNGFLVDGHNRYRICTKHNISFRTEEREFESKDDVKIWMIHNQIGRRNLNPMQRGEIGLGLKDLLAKKGAKNNAHGLTAPGKTPLQNSVKALDKVNAQKDAAAAVGISGDTLHKVEFIKKHGDDDLINAVREGDIKINRAYQKVKCDVDLKEKTNKLKPMMTSDSNEWYTPEEIINRVLEVFEAIDLDPCSNSHITPNVPAEKHYTKEDNGLSKTWKGRVYMNPPYGNEVKAWVEKLKAEYMHGNVTEAIALVPGRIDTQWFNLLANGDTCFLWCAFVGRLKFSNCENSAPFPSVAFYLGENAAAFYDAFGDAGPIYRKIESGDELL